MATGEAGGIIRPVTPADHDGIWAILEPVLRAGETLAVDRAIGREDALALWLSPDRTVRVVEEDGALLGICLGLQLLFEASDEGQRSGLGLLRGRVRALPRRPGYPIPHMGWEPLIAATASPLLPAGCPEAWMYFVHSYAAEPSEPSCNTALVQFANASVTAAVWQGAIGACQFHPEKSGQAGTDLLQRWLRWLAGRQPQGAKQRP